MKGVYDRWIFNRGELEGQANPRTWGKGWRYRVRYENPRTGKLCDKTFLDGKKGEAQKFAAARETHKNEGRQLDVKGGRQLIRTYGPAYVKSLVVTDSTRERYRLLMDNQIVPHLGGKQLIQCVSSSIQTWVRELEIAEFAPATIQLAYDLVSAMFKRAVRDRLISFTPCEDIKLPEKPDNEYWLPEHRQVHELAAAMPARYKAKVYVGGGCGLRHGEVLALDVDAIDFKDKKLRVRHQLVRVKGGGPLHLVKTKTKAGVRDIPMPDHVVAALKEHIAAGYAQDVQVVDDTARRRKGQAAPVVTKRMLFASDKGKFLWTSTWGKMWKTALAKVDGMDLEFDFHGLRHYFASALIRGGSNPKRVQKLCGHSSVEVTLKVYTHLWKDDDDESRDILNRVFEAGAKEVTEPMGHVVYLPGAQADTEVAAAA